MYGFVPRRCELASSMQKTGARCVIFITRGSGIGAYVSGIAPCSLEIATYMQGTPAHTSEIATRRNDFGRQNFEPLMNTDETRIKVQKLSEPQLVSLIRVSPVSIRVQLLCCYVWFFLWLGVCGAFGGEPVLPNTAVLTLEECVQFVEKREGLVLDTRPADIYQRGHIPGAQNLALKDFDADYERLKGVLEADFFRRLVVYCTSLNCVDSGKVREKLAALGYANVAVFKGGYAEWWRAKLPVENGGGG